MPMIRIDASEIPEEIRVVGIPDVLSVDMPTVIDIRVPADIRVPLVFEGPPLSAEVKIILDTQKLIDGDEEIQCVRIVPCPRK